MHTCVHNSTKQTYCTLAASKQSEHKQFSFFLLNKLMTALKQELTTSVIALDTLHTNLDSMVSVIYFLFTEDHLSTKPYMQYMHRRYIIGASN